MACVIKARETAVSGEGPQQPWCRVARCGGLCAAHRGGDASGRASGEACRSAAAPQCRAQHLSLFFAAHGRLMNAPEDSILLERHRKNKAPRCSQLGVTRRRARRPTAHRDRRRQAVPRCYDRPQVAAREDNKPRWSVVVPVSLPELLPLFRIGAAGARRRPPWTPGATPRRRRRLPRRLHGA